MTTNPLITLLILLAMSVTFAQNKAVAENIKQLNYTKTEFQKFKILNQASALQNTISTVENYTLATPNQDYLNAVYNNRYENLEITLPYNGNEITLQLYRVEVTTDNFKVKTNQRDFVPYKPGVHYRGIIKGNDNSIAALNFFEGEFSGFISSTEYHNLNVGKLKNGRNYIIYSNKDLQEPQQWECLASDEGEFDLPTMSPIPNAPQETKCVKIYFELDFDLFQANGSNVQTTMEWMAGAFNNIQTLFANDEITVTISEVFVWETLDPYENAGSIGAYLNRFRQNRPMFNGDAGQLVGLDDDVNGGVAVGAGTLCTNNKHSYSQVDFTYAEVPEFTYTIQVMTHELGHLLGSRHTHACVWNGDGTAIDGCANTEGGCPRPGLPPEGGTIMSYCGFTAVGTDFNNGFGPQPAQVIQNHINSRTCLSESCGCTSTLSNGMAFDITENSAKIQWEDSSEGSELWQYAIRIFGSGDELNWTETNQTSAEFVDLEPNTYYESHIRKDCEAGEYPELKIVFATNGDFCNGALFTDSGGEDGDYGNDQSIVRTVIPATGESVTVNFTSFDLEADNDFINVHNGLNNDAPVIGELTGNNIPGPITADNSDGALTFYFESNGSIVSDGWLATFECATMGVDDADNMIDFTYSPNPVQDFLNISSKTKIQKINVFSIDGKRVKSMNVNNIKADVNMSKLPAGTYLIQLEFKEKTVSFKALKK